MQKKRKKSGLAKSEIASQLGLSYPRYEAVERGLVKMPKHLIDKFNEITNRSPAEIGLEQKGKEVVVNEWFNDMCANKKEKLHNKMKEFNVNDVRHLANLLGYKTGSCVSTYTSHTNIAPFDFKNKMYNFFNNEVNIQIVSEDRIEKKLDESSSELKEWWNNFNVNDYIVNSGETICSLEKKIGLAVRTLWAIARGETKMPKNGTITKIKDYVESHPIVSEQTSIKMPEVEVMPIIRDTTTPEDTMKHYEVEGANIVFEANATIAADDFERMLIEGKNEYLNQYNKKMEEIEKLAIKADSLKKECDKILLKIEVIEEMTEKLK